MDLKALQNLAEQLQWLVETIKERFSQLVTACTESLIAIADMFREVKKKIEVEDGSPKAYGRSPFSQSRHKKQTSSVHYDYTPTVRRHLPYQRRSY